MERIDLKKLDIAITYLKRIADGKNPLNNLPAEEDSVLNNPNVIRCMYFVKEVLEEVKRNSGIIEASPIQKNTSFSYTHLIKSFWYAEDQTLPAFVRHLNMIQGDQTPQKLHYKMILKWLVQTELMNERHLAEIGKYMILPTDAGTKLGIHAVQKTNANGSRYISVILDKNAQAYIVSNIEKIVHEVDDYSNIFLSREDESFHYLKPLSKEARQFVIELTERGERNLYHSIMSVIKNRKNATKEDVLAYYLSKYCEARPYLLENKPLVEEIICLCWNKIHS